MTEKYEPTEEDLQQAKDLEELGIWQNDLSDAEIDKMYEEYCREQNMSITDTIKESLKQIPAELQRTAQSAFADIGNTYQAFLVRDSTYGIHSSQEIAIQAEHDAMEQETPQPTQDIEPER